MSTSTLSEIVEAWGGLIQTGPFGSQLHQYDYSEQGIPVVMPKDIRNGRVDESGIARIPEGKASQLSRHFLKAGSVVFPRRGEISKCAYINEEQAGFLCGTGCIKIEPPEEKLRSKFLFYFLGLRQSVEWLERNAVGTTMLNLNTKILGGLKVTLFASKKQDEIVETLSAYDDLIENNRRRIQLLEKSAQLLYKEWFVHLRFPGHEHTKIIDGVPEGWRRTCLGDLCKLRAGNTFKPKYQGRREGDLPFIKVRDLSRDGNAIAVTGADNWVTLDECEEFRGKPFSKGTSVFAKIGEGLRQNRVRFIVRDTLIDNNMMGAISDQGVAIGEYLYFLLHEQDLANYAGGAAIPFLSSKVLENVGVLAPPMQLLLLFQAAVAPMLQQVVNLEHQSAAAAKARDLLLPKLMNGDIAV